MNTPDDTTSGPVDPDRARKTWTDFWALIFADIRSHMARGQYPTDEFRTDLEIALGRYGDHERREQAYRNLVRYLGVNWAQPPYKQWETMDERMTRLYPRLRQSR